MSIWKWTEAANNRSALVKKNIVASFLLKGIGIFISLQVVPLTISYVNTVQYGIWLTLSSLMSWFFFFDIGLTHGFRNRFAEARAKNDTETARIYVSTTYAALAVLFIGMIVLIAIINGFIDWSKILNIDSAYRYELSQVFMVIVSFFGLNVVFATFTTMLTADQKPALQSFVQVMGQVSAFIVIYILTKVSTNGNLYTLAFVFSGIPVVVTLLSSIVFFRTKYRNVAPTLRYVRFNYVKRILGLGSKFFIITTSMLFIFNLMNVIISRTLGPETVTEYNIAYKYFNVLSMLMVLILNPFWSAFTDAYTKKDYAWMKAMFGKLERLWFMTIPVLLLMYIVAPYFYQFWIGNTVYIPVSTSLSVAVYILFMTFSAIYMYMINGIGKVRIQLIIYTSFALVSYPIMTFMCKLWGISGLLIVPTVVYAFQGILGRIQLKKIFYDKAQGLWNK